MPLLHETARCNDNDRFYVIGMNPDDSGGGIIGTAPTMKDADELRVQALKANYSHVQIRTWRELMREED